MFLIEQKVGGYRLTTLQISTSAVQQTSSRSRSMILSDQIYKHVQIYVQILCLHESMWMWRLVSNFPPSVSGAARKNKKEASDFLLAQAVFFQWICACHFFGIGSSLFANTAFWFSKVHYIEWNWKRQNVARGIWGCCSLYWYQVTGRTVGNLVRQWDQLYTWWRC